MSGIMRSMLAGAAMLLLVAQPAVAGKNDPLKIARPEAVKGVQTVVVGAFNVGFLFESVDDTAGRAGSGLINAFSGPTKVKSMLEGVPPATMQAITDKAYADFTAQLAARGFTVVAPAALFASTGFAKVKPMAAPFDVTVTVGKNSKAKSSFFKPGAVPAQVMLPGDFTAGPSGLAGVPMIGGFAAIGQIGRAMEGMEAYTGMTTYARETGQAVIDVVYLIDFSDAKRPGAFSFSGIKVNSGMSVAGNYSKLNLIAPSGKQASIIVQQPVAVEGDFATMADSTGGFNKGSETAVNVLGAFVGVGAGKTRKYTFTAKPEAYEAGAIKAASLANARLVDQLAALR